MADATVLADEGRRDDPREDGLRVNLTHMPYETDAGVGPRARIGAVVLATDCTLEEEWRRMLRLDGVAVYHSRVMNSPDITPETLRQREGRLADTARMLLPGVGMDAIAYGCTSASIVITSSSVMNSIAVAGNALKTAGEASPISIRALRSLRSRRVASVNDDVSRKATLKRVADATPN